MNKTTAIIFLIFSAFCFNNCDSFLGTDNEPPKVCTGLAEPAIVATVTDAKTGQYIARDAKGIITDGAYTDSLHHSHITQTNPLIVASLAAGEERAGTYDVYIKVEGYEPWSVQNIKVRKGNCGPKTQHLNARLEPLKK